MNLLSERPTVEKLGLEKLGIKKLRLERLQWPPAPHGRHLLAYFHSGDVLRRSLPKLLRISMAVWFLLSLIVWITAWPAIYEEFERWGLVKAFGAQLISLATAFLILRITLLRAEHLQVLPPDDFLTLRSVAVLCRCVGEVALVYVLGMGLSALLQPVGPVLNSMLGELAPQIAAQVSSGTSKLLLVSAPLSLFFIWMAVLLFLGLYSVATAIDVALAVEFNTRAERVKGQLS